MRYLALLSILLIAACSRDHETQKGGNPSTELSGQWRISQWNFGTGMPGTVWQDVPFAQQYTLKFSSDSSFTYSGNYPMADSGFNRYHFTDNKLEFYSTNNTKSVLYGVVKLTNDEMELSPLSWFCFEGCSYRFKRK